MKNEKVTIDEKTCSFPYLPYILGHNKIYIFSCPKTYSKTFSPGSYAPRLKMQNKLVLYLCPFPLPTACCNTIVLKK